jgi:hypothetical protein
MRILRYRTLVSRCCQYIMRRHVGRDGSERFTCAKCGKRTTGIFTEHEFEAPDLTRRLSPSGGSRRVTGPER